MNEKFENFKNMYPEQLAEAGKKPENQKDVQEFLKTEEGGIVIGEASFEELKRLNKEMEEAFRLGRYEEAKALIDDYAKHVKDYKDARIYERNNGLPGNYDQKLKHDFQAHIGDDGNLNKALEDMMKSSDKK